MKCYHLTNPIFLDQIIQDGLKPMVGDSTILNHGEDVTPCIFLSLTYEDRFDSTYPEDVLLEVNIPDDQKFEYDPKHIHNKWIMVFEPIGPDNISIFNR